MFAIIKTSRSRSLITIALATLLVATGAAIIQPSSAQAYATNGCKFAGTAPTIPIKYSTLVTSNTITAMNGAIGRWNATIPLTLLTTTATGYKVLVTELSSTEDYWAVTQGSCATGGGKTWSGVVSITWNTPLTGNPSTTGRRMIGTHELGHSMGLNHVSATSCSSTHAVMGQGTWKFSCGWGTEPWTDDINGINAVY
ncbi:hypothetical protein BH11ACT2_BH11ACT2_04870 [soil metagenome]